MQQIGSPDLQTENLLHNKIELMRSQLKLQQQTEIKAMLSEIVELKKL
jgi:hypothetical protein|tara:strand:+ start:1197 stop:1340 length:144 start_codon:yes stop_codon:yes gene_type:complete